MPDAHPIPDTPTIEAVITSTQHVTRPASSESSFNSADSALDDEEDDEEEQAENTTHPTAQEDHDMTDAPPPPPPPPETHPSESLPPPPRSDGWGTRESSDRDGSWGAAAAAVAVDKHPWVPIYEDNSPPGEDELKRLETAGEVSAFDHEHWQKKAFKDLGDPGESMSHHIPSLVTMTELIMVEYNPIASGRIEWVISTYNGTQEKPNKELLMRSEPVMIGGHPWRIKLYPKGNGTSYLGAYIECDTFTPTAPTMPRSKDSEEDLDISLPLLEGSPLKKPRQIPAQIMLLMYNPKEPRVHFQKKSSHSFTDGDPDRGFSRFGPTPYYDLGRRLPETRQAMLQNDMLGFIAHVRIFDDPTGFLFGRESYDYQKEFARTGLKPVKGVVDSRGYAANLTSAVFTFVLLPPVRQILYQASNADKSNKPLLESLLSFLCDIRKKPVSEGPNPFSITPVVLEKVADGIRWHGKGGHRSLVRHTFNSTPDRERFSTRWHPYERGMQDFDVFQVWEFLHGVLENELKGTAMAGKLNSLFHPGGFRFKVPAAASSIRQSLCEALSKTDKALLPQILQVELPRQEFQEKTKKWRKVEGRVAIDDKLEMTEEPTSSYTLYGVVLHTGPLNSRQYTPLLRLSKNGWYKFPTDRTGGILKVTKKQAMGDMELNAYAAIYMRTDMANAQLFPDSPSFIGYPETDWKVPQRFLDVAKEATVHARESENKAMTIPPDGLVVKVRDDTGAEHLVEVRRGEENDTPIHAVVIPRTPLAPVSASPCKAESDFDSPAGDEVHEIDYFAGGYYKGRMHKGYRHGTGRKIYIDGNCYEGRFRKDLRHGQGKQVFQNGDTYEGLWTDDRMHGTGVFISKSTGNIYRGGYKEGKQHGEFTLSGNKAEALKGCLICYERDRDAVFYPCGHMCACMECARELEDCPYCHRQIAEPIRLYLT